MKWLKSIFSSGAQKGDFSSQKKDVQSAAQYVGKNFGRAIEKLADR